MGSQVLAQKSNFMIMIVSGGLAQRALFDQYSLLALPDIDDLMDEGVTDEDGHFELQGKETEITNIDPKLNVYHVIMGNELKY